MSTRRVGPNVQCGYSFGTMLNICSNENAMRPKQKSVSEGSTKM